MTGRKREDFYKNIFCKVPVRKRFYNSCIGMEQAEDAFCRKVKREEPYHENDIGNKRIMQIL